MPSFYDPESYGEVTDFKPWLGQELLEEFTEKDKEIVEEFTEKDNETLEETVEEFTEKDNETMEELAEKDKEIVEKLTEKDNETVEEFTEKDNETVEEDLDPTLTIDDLPEDVFHCIFTYLDPASVKAVRLVSSHWKDMIETAKFWSWAQLTVDSCNPPVPGSNLVQCVPRIRITRSADSEDFINFLEDLFTEILAGNCFQLTNVNLCCCKGLSSLSPSLLEAVVRVASCDLDNCFLTREQLTVLFKAIQDTTDLKLRNLKISQNSNISSVEPELLQAVVRLESCHLCWCNLTTDQLRVLFRAIKETTELSLKSLDMRNNYNISSCEAGLLHAVVRLEECYLYRYILLSSQTATPVNNYQATAFTGQQRKIPMFSLKV